MLKKGFYATLEGPEGSGKTTQIGMAAEKLRKKGLEVITTREPGGTSIGRKFRAILLDPDSVDITPRAELFGYCADRAQHYKEVLEPALKKGKIILGDRGPDASLLYQGYARGVNLETIRKVNSIALEGLNPDVTIFIVGDAEYFLERAWRSIEETGDLDIRFEQEALEFHKKILAGAYELAKTDEQRYALVEDKRKEAPEVINAKIMNILDSKLGI